MKKNLLLVVVLMLTMVVLFGCGGKKAEVEQTIKFGTLPAESAIPIIIAKEKGFFAQEGVDVEVIPFTSPNDRNVAVQAGKIDGIIADVMTSLTFHEAGFAMKITSDINEDFKLLTSPNSGIDSFAELDQRDVSLVPNFILEYIMDEMAKANGITYKVVSIPSFSARFEALLNDQISAVIFTEPQATMLRAKGAGLLATSKEFGIKAGTLLFNEKVLQDYPSGMKAFYRGYNAAVEYINTTDASQYSQVLKSYGFPDAIAGYLGGEVKYDQAQTISKESFQSVLKWTQAKGRVEKDYTLEQVSNFDFISE